LRSAADEEGRHWHRTCAQKLLACGRRRANSSRTIEIAAIEDMAIDPLSRTE
jgi:hypothetical protein